MTYSTSLIEPTPVSLPPTSASQLKRGMYLRFLLQAEEAKSTGMKLRYVLAQVEHADPEDSLITVLLWDKQHPGALRMSRLEIDNSGVHRSLLTQDTPFVHINSRQAGRVLFPVDLKATPGVLR